MQVKYKAFILYSLRPQNKLYLQKYNRYKRKHCKMQNPTLFCNWCGQSNFRGSDTPLLPLTIHLNVKRALFCIESNTQTCTDLQIVEMNQRGLPHSSAKTTQLLPKTLTVSLSYSSVPVRHEGVTASQHVQYKEPETDAAKWNSTINFII